MFKAIWSRINKVSKIDIQNSTIIDYKQPLISFAHHTRYTYLTIKKRINLPSDSCDRALQ
jgi:hypothetical protein